MGKQDLIHASNKGTDKSVHSLEHENSFITSMLDVSYLVT